MLVGIVMQMSGFVSGQKVQPAEVSHTILMILSVGTSWCCSADSSFPCASD
jgi:oligogalacturonide transporter